MFLFKRMFAFFYFNFYLLKAIFEVKVPYALVALCFLVP